MATAERVAHVLGGPLVLKTRVRSWDDLERLVTGGLPKRSLQLVARRVVAPGTAASTLVHRVVSPATFKRRTRLTADESAHTERLARVVALAEHLWGSQADARAFLNRPHPLLDGAAPLDVAHSELGARRVERLIHDVEHGLAV